MAVLSVALGACENMLYGARQGTIEYPGSGAGPNAAAVYVVKDKDTVDNVAQRYGVSQQVIIDRNKLKYGTWGLGLEGMLEDARRFVSGKHSSEFLILKFDKCSNWPLIAETCVRVLGPSIYTGTGNLNTKTLGQLSGKVIVLFTPDGITVVASTTPGFVWVHGVGGQQSTGDIDHRHFDTSANARI